MKTNRKPPVPAAPRKLKVPTAAALWLSAPQVCERYGGRSHMWLVRKLENDPTFPHPYYFGRLRFFKIAELEDYERRAAVARQPAEARAP